MRPTSARRMLPVIAMILSAPHLASCGEKVHVKATKPPARLLSCSGEPLAPVLPPRDGTEATEKARDALTLAYVLAFRAAWGDCFSKVSGTKAWSDALPD